MADDRLLGEEVTARLRDAIVSGELKPRQRLVESELAAEFGVSRTPIREAILQLERSGLVQREAYRGAVVADLDMEALVELYAVRAALEGMAARVATPNLRDEDFRSLDHLIAVMRQAAADLSLEEYERTNLQFHEVIYTATHNRQLITLITDLLGRTTPLRRTSWRSPKSLASSMNGHEEILTALRARDALKARDAAEAHTRLFVTENGGGRRLSLPLDS